MELVVANPSSATDDSLKNTFQTLFTKRSHNSKVLSPEDTCQRLLRSMENDRRAMHFLLKQFLVQSRNQGQHSGELVRAYEAIQREIEGLKRTINTEKIQQDKTIAELQHRVQAAQQKVQEQQQILNEKDMQVNQLRHYLSQDRAVLVPSSSNSYGSNGSRRSHGSSATPPIHGFLLPKQARVHNACGGSPAQNNSDAHSIVTPIVAPYQHRRNSLPLFSSQNRSPYGRSTSSFRGMHR